MMLECEPIGYFHSLQTEKYMAPKQAELAAISQGQITLNSGCNFEAALADLRGFSRIWVIFWFHKNCTWRPKVHTPRGGAKRGVFATRSPHRPNPIGLSSIELLDVHGRTLVIGKSDLLDGTPILDIKPYLAYADSFTDVKHGWLDLEEEKSKFRVIWQERALEQATYIENETGFALRFSATLRLEENPYPFPSHRIKKLAENSYELAVKSFRVLYTITENSVQVREIVSGYDQKTLEEEQESRFGDVAFHKKFITHFY